MAFTNIISGTIGGNGNIIYTNYSSKSNLQVRYDGTGDWLECSENANITGKSNCSFELKLKDGETLTTMQDMFWDCSSLTSLDLSHLDTSSVTNMQSVFNNCSSLTSLNVSNFNTSQVTTMNSMFYNCSSLISLDLSSFNTSQVTNMLTMFYDCTKLTSLDLSNFDTSNVINMDNMFFHCSLSDIGLLYATSTTINSLLTLLETHIARNIYYTDAPLDELTVQNNITYIKYESSQATFPYTLNKLPNDVADYIDVVNKVHVQRVGRVVLDGSTNDTVTKWVNDTWSFANDVAQLDCFVTNIKGYTDNTISTLSDKLPSLNWSDAFKGGASNVDRSEGILAYVNGALVILLSTSRISKSSTLEEKLSYLQSNPITVLYELATPIYTPLTEEEIVQLPLSAYADGYINLSSDQLMPSFEFRMRASNRYQVDMLETGYYYLNAPVGNVKLGTANIDVQQMPCIVKVDNVGTGDSGYRLGFDGDIYFTYGKFIAANGELASGEGDVLSDYLVITDKIVGITSDDSRSQGFGICIGFYNESRNFINQVTSDIHGIISSSNYFEASVPSNAKYCRISYRVTEKVSRYNNSVVGASSPITLAKLPSHRIPTTFTQGMRCGTDFGYWEGIKSARPSLFKTVDRATWNHIEVSEIEGGSGVVLNRIEYNNTIVEDELDIATGKLTKRIKKIMFDGSDDERWFIIEGGNLIDTHIFSIEVGSKGKKQFDTLIRCDKFVARVSGVWDDDEHIWINEYNDVTVHIKKDRVGNLNVDNFKKWLQQNPITIYYELAVPEISYPNISLSQVKTIGNTALQCNTLNNYLNPQIKPSHLTYPVPSLVGNRTYTVIHNRKNISGSTKPIELNLGGTVTQLNDASGKTLVKTPSTLAHSNLIFIGGESTVDHIMVLDGDWTNKPIEYFENMMGHDTDAIITIIGNGQINDVEEQYLW